jgi:FAD/FMN-containing dehydrogenase
MRSFFTDYQPAKVLAPKTAAEVQAIIAQANKDKTPLVPVSSGTNLQDTHLPSVKGAVAVDLSGLKGLYCDELNRNVVVEPGVTFQELDAFCKKTGLRTLTAIDVPATASVLSTYLEMLPLYAWPKYHPWEMLTMEGYRADGHRFATGQMAMCQDRPDKYSWGCSFAQVARLYCLAQGTLGIITKVAVTLKTDMPKTQVLFFACKNINQATAALKAFAVTEEPHEIFAVNKTYFAEMTGTKPAAAMPAWIVVLVNRGADQAELDFKRKDAAAIARKLKGTILTAVKGAPGAADAILAEIKSPTGAALHAADRRWTPVVTVSTARQIQQCAGMFPAAAGTILMPLQAGACFYYQPDLRYREQDIDAARKTYLDICKKMLKAGVTFPRPSALIAGEVAKLYPENNKLLRAVKKAIDPKNIMNPGKLGL